MKDDYLVIKFDFKGKNLPPMVVPLQNGHWDCRLKGTLTGVSIMKARNYFKQQKLNRMEKQS